MLDLLQFSIRECIQEPIFRNYWQFYFSNLTFGFSSLSLSLSLSHSLSICMSSLGLIHGPSVPTFASCSYLHVPLLPTYPHLHLPTVIYLHLPLLPTYPHLHLPTFIYYICLFYIPTFIYLLHLPQTSIQIGRARKSIYKRVVWVHPTTCVRVSTLVR